MAYNIEWMNSMFYKNVVKPKERARAEKIADIIKNINPHLLGISEAANAPEEHNDFIQNFLPGLGYRVAHGSSRGAQNLVFYYRDPLSVVKIDDAISYYDTWIDDVDDDGLKEQHRWHRKPLEVVFKIGQGGPKIRVVLVHTKSKGVFSVVDFGNFQKIALANRKRLVGQAYRLRRRLDTLLNGQNPLPIIVMGDMNDGPGLDVFERVVGRSFVETVVGSVFEPEKIFHNTLWKVFSEAPKNKRPWTAQFADPIVGHPFKWKHRVWIDHIIASPDMLGDRSPVSVVRDSGKLGPSDEDALEASDHRAIYSKIMT